jgi:hypothetical protein
MTTIEELRKENESLKVEVEATKKVNCFLALQWYQLKHTMSLSELSGLGEETCTDVAICHVASEFVKLKEDTIILKRVNKKHNKNIKELKKENKKLKDEIAICDKNWGDLSENILGERDAMRWAETEQHIIRQQEENKKLTDTILCKSAQICYNLGDNMDLPTREWIDTDNDQGNYSEEEKCILYEIFGLDEDESDEEEYEEYDSDNEEHSHECISCSNNAPSDQNECGKCRPKWVSQS